MKSIIPYIPVLFVLWWAFSAYWYVCEINGHDCFGSSNVPSMSLTVKDGNKSVLTINQQPKFALSSANVVLDKVAKKGLKKLALYLQKNPLRQLQIIGKYRSEEDNLTDKEDLGIARANALKTKLVDEGVSKEQIATLSQVNNTLAIYQDTLVQTLDLLLQQRRLVTPEVEKQLLTQSMSLVFTEDGKAIVETKESRQYLETIKRYLKQEPQRKVVVESLVDVGANKEEREQLATQKMEFTQKELEDSGIDKEQIVAKLKTWVTEEVEEMPTDTDEKIGNSKVLLRIE